MNTEAVIKQWRKFLPKHSGLKHVLALQEQHQQRLDCLFDLDNSVIEVDIKYYDISFEDPTACTSKSLVLFQAKDKGHRLEGFLREGVFIGNALKTWSDGSKELFFMKNGVKHGYSVSYDRNLCLKWFGLYQNGRRQGTWWEFLENNCGCFVHYFKDGRSEDQKIFLYPNYKFGYQGVFEHHQMIEAYLVEVSGIGMDFGVLLPLVKTICPTPAKYLNGIDCDPLAPDPLESLMVVVKVSSIPGADEGLFAKRSFEPGDLVAYFNGLRIKVSEAQFSDYALYLEDGWLLDIPQEFRSLTKYKSTLGHKVCHSFEANAEYSHGFHPKYGHIRIILATHHIEKGQEIFCNYKYSWAKSPEWYKASLKSYLRDKGKSEDKIAQIIANLESGKTPGHNDVVSSTGNLPRKKNNAVEEPLPPA